MADGDTVKPSILDKSNLMDRDCTKRYSYFFNHQVERCLVEQHQVLGSKLAEMENKVEMTYDKPLVELFGPNAPIDSAFLQLVFNSDEQVNLDGLIDDLRTLATKDSPKDVTRLLDLLLVTNRKTLLTEEQELRNAPYDLYDKKLKGNFDSLAAFTNLLTSGQQESSSLALVFSMMASGQKDLINSALVHMAINLEYTWDALVLSRYFNGAGHDVTRKVFNTWKSAVMKETDNNVDFRMIKIVNSFDESNLKDVARTLLEGATNKQDPRDLIYAYRCLALNLARPSPLPELARQLEVAEVSNLIRSIFITLLSWGKLDSARSLVVDISKRARPSGMPADFCEIGIRCHLELTEILMKLQGIVDDEVPTVEAPLKHLAMKWRGEINQEYSDMRKLKTEIPGQQTVVYEWLSQLGGVLRTPLFAEELESVNKKMQCILISCAFFHEMIRWAVTGKDEEPLQLRWPLGVPSFNINDDSIIMESISRSRANSVGSSTKSSLPYRGDDEKQKKKSESKEIRSASITREKMGEGNQCNKEQIPNYGQDSRGRQPMQKLNRDGAMTFVAKGNEKLWERGVLPATQDVRKSKYSSGDPQDSRRSLDRTGDATQESRRPAHPNGSGTEQHGSGMQVFHSSKYTALMNNTCDSQEGIDPSSISAARSGYMNSPRGAPTCSASTSDQSVASHTPSVLDNPEIADAVAKNQEELEQVQSQSAPLSSQSIQTTSQGTAAGWTKMDESEKTIMNGAAANVQQTNSHQLPTSPSSQQCSIPQQPTMGTCAANEVRVRRSLENVQSSSDQESQLMQQSPDPHYQDLMKHVQDSENNRSFAPEPSEMNKLFTGNTKGQSTLPPFLVAEQADVSAASVMQPPPVPTFVASAESNRSSLDLTQLTPSESVVLASDNISIRTCQSSSADSMLTPITEASRETLGTMSRDFSESDALGLAHDESMDTVFEEGTESNQNPLHVSVGLPLSQSTPHGSLASQLTPNERDLMTPLMTPVLNSPQSLSAQGTPCEDDLKLTNSYHSSNQSGFDGREEMQKQADTLSSSPTITESTVTDRWENTTEVQVMGVRGEAENTNQMLPSSIPPVNLHQIEVQMDNSSPFSREMQSQTSPQMYQPTIPHAGTVGTPIPSQPIQPSSVAYVEMQQQVAQGQVPAVNTGFAPYQPPSVSHPTMTNQSYSLNNTLSTPQFAPPTQHVQMQVASAPFTPNVPVVSAPMGNAMTAMNENENTMNAHQMGQVNEQSVPAVQEQPLARQMKTTMHQQSMSYSVNGQLEQPTGTPTDQQLQLNCTEPEVKELVTSCGIPYKFSPTTTEMSSAPSSSMENSHPMQPPPQETQGGGFLDGFLSQIGSTVAAVGGEVVQEGVSAEQIASAEHSMPNTAWSSEKSMSKEEIDEHAAQRRQEASERGDASEFGSMSASHPFPETYSEVHTVPSTALTTPDHNGQSHFDYNAPSGNEVNLGGASVEEKYEVNQMPSQSASATSTMGGGWGHHSQQQSQSTQQINQPRQFTEFVPQQPAVAQVSVESFTQHQQPIQQFNQQQMQHSGIVVSQESASNEWVTQSTVLDSQSNPQQIQQPANSPVQESVSNESSAHHQPSIPQLNQQQAQPSQNLAAQQSTTIPVYHYPFSQQSTTQQQVNQPSGRGLSNNSCGNGMGEEAAPCFGTGGGNRVVNVQQSGGHGGTSDNRNHGLAENYHGQGGQNQYYRFNRGRGGQNQSQPFSNHNQGRGGHYQGHGDHNQTHGINKAQGDQSQTHGLNQGQANGLNQGQGDQNNFHGLNQGQGDHFHGQAQGDQSQSHGLNVEQGSQKQGGGGFIFEGGRRGRGGGGRGRGGERGGRSGRGYSSFGGGNQQQSGQSGHGQGSGFYGGGDNGQQKSDQMNPNQGTVVSQDARRGSRGFHH